MCESAEGCKVFTLTHTLTLTRTLSFDTLALSSLPPLTPHFSPPPPAPPPVCTAPMLFRKNVISVDILTQSEEDVLEMITGCFSQVMCLGLVPCLALPRLALTD